VQATSLLCASSLLKTQSGVNHFDLGQRIATGIRRIWEIKLSFKAHPHILGTPVAMRWPTEKKATTLLELAA
jgi:hypothetical protein